ncbi:MAG: hypothetical protein E7160_03810 [Firmicutes bacterium]|nr:hypothetical protein [Bacillota bacterium]
MKKGNIDYKSIIKFIKTPRGKAFLFFGFYLVFFFVLGVMFRTSAVNDSYDNEEIKKSNFPFLLGQIENNNYHFKYSYDFDGKVNAYEGDKFSKKELFSFKGLNYYRNDDIFLINNSNVWVKCDNPYYAYQFIDISSIKKMIKKATYISKTDYESGMKVYSYQVSTATLVKLVDNIDIDLDDKPNEIILKTDKDNNVNDIKFDLTSYFKYKKVSNIKAEIELLYTNFGEVKELNDPE